MPPTPLPHDRVPLLDTGPHERLKVKYRYHILSVLSVQFHGIGCCNCKVISGLQLRQFFGKCSGSSVLLAYVCYNNTEYFCFLILHSTPNLSLCSWLKWESKLNIKAKSHSPFIPSIQYDSMIWGLSFFSFMTQYFSMQTFWWLTHPQNMQMNQWTHDTWAVGQHGRIEEVASQWMVLYGTTIPIWGLKPKNVKDHVLDVIPHFKKSHFRGIWVQ